MSFLPRWLWLLLVFCVCNQATLWAQEHEFRIWTDSTGKKQVRARFYDLKDGVVRLERPNGDISRAPLEKLSQEDQDYVRQTSKSQSAPAGTPSAAKKKTAEKKTPELKGLEIGDRVEVEHFGRWREGVVVDIDYEWQHAEVRISGERHETTADMEELRYPGTNQQPFLVPPRSPTSDLKTVRPDLDSVRRLVASGGEATKIAADPRPAGKNPGKLKPIRLSGRTDFFESPVDFGLCFEPQPLALVVHENKHHETLPRVELIDVAVSRVLMSGQAPEGTSEVHFSPSGKLVATLQNNLHGREGTGQIDFWKVADKKLEHLLSFVPYVMNTWPDLNAEWFAWLDDEQAFTVNREGQLLLWNVTTGKAIYELIVERGATPTLSPGRKYLFLPTATGLQCLEAATGEPLATIGSADFRHARLAFSPSGRQLAVVTAGFLDVVDVTTGQTTRSFPCSTVGSHSDVYWLDEEFLYVDGGSIIHAPLRVTAWKFQLDAQKVKLVGSHLWALLENHSQGTQILTPLELPPPEAKQAIAGLNEEEMLVVRPGETIAVDVQIHDANFLAEDVEAALQQALQDAGMKVAENEHLKLVARSRYGENETVYYRTFGQFRGEGQPVSVTSQIYELELQLDGTPVWKREAKHSAPHFVSMQRGESIQDAVARIMKPTAGFFSGRLPSYVLRAEFLEPLGTSRLSLGF